jgi:hypothetical protein
METDTHPGALSLSHHVNGPDALPAGLAEEADDLDDDGFEVHEAHLLYGRFCWDDSSNRWVRFASLAGMARSASS